jgi:hypothetical protein
MKEKIKGFRLFSCIFLGTRKGCGYGQASPPASHAAPWQNPLFLKNTLQNNGFPVK